MFIEELRKGFKGEIADDAATLSVFSHDASIFEVKPALVISPKDSTDVQYAVKAVLAARAAGEHVSLTARAAGTCMSGGSLTDSVVVNMMPHMNTMSDVEISADKKSGYAVVQPGVFYRDFDAETRRRDLIMPAYPASRELAAIGGMISNNAGGEKSPVYGKIERYLLELTVILADGNEYVFKPLSKAELEAKMKMPTFEGRLYKQIFELLSKNDTAIKAAKPAVSKNSAGYYLWNIWDETANEGKGVFDLTQLIVGSQGTLGIVTEAKLRLVPVPKVSKLMVIFLKELSRLGDLVAALHETHPESLESYDDKTFKLVLRYFPQFVKLMHQKGLLSLAWQFIPEFFTVIKMGGIPKMVLMVEFTGDTAAGVEERVARATEAIKKFNVPFRVTHSEEESHKYWTMRRESFSLMRNNLRDRHTAPFIDDFAVKPEVMPEFLPKLTAILDSYSFAYGMAGHPGDGNFHIFPMLKLEDQNERAIIPKLSEQVYDLVLQYKGTITAEHNDGLVRSPYLEKMYGADIMRLFEATKKIFDPENIFNPGKKVGSSLGYSLSHIRKSF
jgi:FAD/FMN-containing dehydrogenase